MRPLTLLALLLSLVWWQSPPYLRDYWWHTLVYYLTGEWLAQVQHVAQVWKWIPAHCNLTMAWQQLSFMQLPFLVGWGARTLGQRASRASVDWLLRLLCLCAGLHLMALFSMFYKSYLACPEGRHGGACKTTIDDGVGSLVVLEWWLDSIWLRLLTAVMMLAEGWRVRMSFQRSVLYALCSLGMSQILAWPLWLLDYRQHERSNSLAFAHVKLQQRQPGQSNENSSSGPSHREGISEELARRIEMSEPRRSLPITPLASESAVPLRPRGVPLSLRLAEPSVGGVVNMERVVGEFVAPDGSLVESKVREAEALLANGTSPFLSRPFPTLQTSTLLGFTLPLHHILPLFYLCVGIIAGWTWLTWMDAWVINRCFLDGFLGHLTDNPAAFMMYSGPLWGVFVCTTFIWSVEPVFRSEAEIRAGVPRRTFQIALCYILSLFSFIVVVSAMAFYLAWREFRLMYLTPTPMSGLAREDASVWRSSLPLQDYLDYDRMAQRRATQKAKLRAAVAPLDLTMTPAKTPSTSAASTPRADTILESPSGSPASPALLGGPLTPSLPPLTPSAVDEHSTPRHTSRLHTINSIRHRRSVSSHSASASPSALDRMSLETAREREREIQRDRERALKPGVWTTLSQGMDRATDAFRQLLSGEVCAAWDEATTFMLACYYRFRYVTGFAPLPAPVPRQGFLDWSLLLPFLLLTWVLALNSFVLCWMLNIDVTWRALFSTLSMFVSFFVVVRNPERMRLVYAWLFFETEEEREARSGRNKADGACEHVGPNMPQLNVPLVPPRLEHLPSRTYSAPTTMPYLARLGSFAGASETDPLGLPRINPHLVFTCVVLLLYLIATFLVLPDAQMHLPWWSHTFATIRENVINNIHRGSESDNIALLCVTALMAYAMLFGFRLFSPSLSRGMPARFPAKVAIVFPLVFIFLVVWPHVTLPCTRELGIETPVLTPKDYTDMAAAIRTAIEERAKSQSPKLRPVHPKTHGCVKATFSTAYYLSPKYRFGLFADDAASGLPLNMSASPPLKSWDAFVRFSNGALATQLRDGSWALQPDNVPDVRGMAVKLILPLNSTEAMSLSEEEIRAAATDRNTQDFLTITSSYFFQEDGASYAQFIQALASADLSLMLAWLKPPSLDWAGLKQMFRRLRTLYLVWQMNQDGVGVMNPLRAEYYSAVPYRLGPDQAQAAHNMRPVMAVKYRWRPCTPTTAAHIHPPYVVSWLREVQASLIGGINSLYRFVAGSKSDLLHSDYFDTIAYREAQIAKQNPSNYLRINLQNALDPFREGNDGACFDLLLQDQTDACVNSVEDSTRIWKGDWVRAGRLHIPPQSFLSTQQLEVCENLNFNPWHSLRAHHPLGDVNKLRKTAYLTAGETRRVLNGVPLNHTGTVYTGRELDAHDSPGAKESTNLRGNPAQYAYSTYPAPFQALPKKIDIMPFSEQMSNATAVNIRVKTMRTFMAPSYPQSKLYGEFTRPQDYEYLELSRPDEPVYPNTNHAVSGRMRRPPHVDENVWTRDDWWARQFTQGLNPMLLERVANMSVLPSALAPLNEQNRNKIAEVLRAEDMRTIEELAAAGRLFLLDYWQMENIMTYQNRLLYAPIVLFYLSSLPGRPLLPLFIQLERCSSPPLYFPAPYIPGAARQSNEAMVWLFARMHVSSADAVMLQLLFHLLETHLALEPVIIATHRAFTPSHPVSQLLKQHFSGTLAMNDFGRTTLVADMNAQVDQIMATGFQGSMQLMASYYNHTYRFMETMPAQIERRGFRVAKRYERDWGSDRDELPGFLYRDYGLALWYEMKAYVHDVLDTRFGRTQAERDAKFASDVEIAAWMKELHDPSSANIKQYTPVRNYAELVELLTQIIFQSSAQHAAVNFPQYEFQAFQPARPLFLTRGMPSDLSIVDEEYVASSFMPPGSFSLLVSLVDILTACCVNTLMLDEAESEGAGLILDDAPTTTPAFPVEYDRFKQSLRKLEQDMRNNNARFGYNYPYLYPSRVPQSTAI